MTRPKDLPPALQSWANGNYSAGPSWGSTPQRAAPGAAFLTPGVTLPAENANYLHGNAFDGAQGAISAVGQLPALNWRTPITPSGTLAGANYSDAEQAWYVCKTAAVASIYKSFDFGATWTSPAIAAATAQGDVAFDPAGNCVIAPFGAGTGVQEGPFVSYGTAITFTNHAAAITAGTATNNVTVVYEPVNALWCILNSLAATNIKAWTSPDRITWTARTPFATTTAGQMNTTLGVGNGLLVAAYANASGLLRVSRSSNGGVTWTNEQNLTIDVAITMSLAAGDLSFSRPVWSPTDGLWYITANQFSTRKCQVWSSPDAITWTAVVSMLANDVCITHIVCLGTLMVGVSGYQAQSATNQDGRLYVSVNKGANWFRTGAPVDNRPTFVRSGGNGIAIVTGLGAIGCSARFGMPVTAV